MIHEIKSAWRDHPEAHAMINESFAKMVDASPGLKAHRDWTEQNIFGFGERSFLWLHKLLVEEMPSEFTFMEIGVFRGAILSLYEMLAQIAGKSVTRYGITPLDGTDGHWDSDYSSDIEQIHDQFGIMKDYKILHGLSTDPGIIKEAADAGPIDILYIDGGHSYEVVKSDLANYPQLIRPGGYLVVDDCCNEMKMPFGYFQGIESVTRAVREVLPNAQFEFLFSVVHIKVFQRI